MPDYPDHRKDLKSSSRNLGPYTTKGYSKGTPLRGSVLDPSGGLGLGSCGLGFYKV